MSTLTYTPILSNVDEQKKTATITYVPSIQTLPTITRQVNIPEEQNSDTISLMISQNAPYEEWWKNDPSLRPKPPEGQEPAAWKVLRK